MAQLPDVFNVQDNKGSDQYGIMPPGWYEAEIIKSEIKTTKAGTGKYIALRFRVTEGEHKDRFIFDNLNIVNPNPAAVKIAKETLSKICEAVGITDDLDDTEDLHDIPLMINVQVKPAQGQWPEGNEIKGYQSMEKFLDNQTESDSSSNDPPF